MRLFEAVLGFEIGFGQFWKLSHPNSGALRNKEIFG